MKSLTRGERYFVMARLGDPRLRLLPFYETDYEMYEAGNYHLRIGDLLRLVDTIKELSHEITD